MLAVFDFAQYQPRQPPIRQGARIATLNKHAPDSAATMGRYVRSLSPGATISITFAITDRNSMAATSERIMLMIADARPIHFAT